MPLSIKGKKSTMILVVKLARNKISCFPVSNHSLLPVTLNNNIDLEFFSRKPSKFFFVS